MFQELSPTTRTGLRVAAAIAISITAGLTTVVLYFVGIVTATGCFIECSDPNVVGGSLLLAGAVLSSAVTVSAVVWGAIGWNRRVLVRVAAAVVALATLLLLLVVGAFW